MTYFSSYVRAGSQYFTFNFFPGWSLSEVAMSNIALNRYTIWLEIMFHRKQMVINYVNYNVNYMTNKNFNFEWSKRAIGWLSKFN